ncbi:MAG: hypothetical protein IT215_03695 [Chitinophagaceae bacterium]|nr:hypothetical protein [Chitinophagaceae bacterium]
MTIRNFFFLLFFLLLNIVISHLFYSFFLRYIDKSAYLWHASSKREDYKKEYDFFFLGDSQLMSGIDPNLLENRLGKDRFLYFPRPSDQPEGIYTFLKTNLKPAQLKNKKFFINISPITTSKNGLFESHKNLQIHSSNYLFFDNSIRKLYLKKISENIFYFFSILFPILKLQTELQSHLKFIQTTTLINLHSKNLQDYLEVDTLQILQKEKEQNLFLEKEVLSKKFYWEWNSFSPNAPCQKAPLHLSSEYSATFMTDRPQAALIWKQIGEYILQNGGDFRFVYIPFSPESEIFFQIQHPNSPFQKTIFLLSEHFGQEKILFISSLNLQEDDFVDAIHPNHCGARKITTELLDKWAK